MRLSLMNNVKLVKIFNDSIIKPITTISLSKLAVPCLLGLAASQSFQSSVRGIIINDTAGADTAKVLGAPFTSVAEMFFLDSDESICSGSLIADLYLLTAQHCIQDSFAEDWTILFGGDDPENSTLANILVNNIFAVDDTFSLLDGTDIAILELAEAAPESITRLKLFGNNPKSLIGTNATVVGFGNNGLGSIGHEFTADGLRWGAENIIDLLDGGFDPAFNVTFGSNIFNLDFDDGTPENNTLSSFGSSNVPLDNEGTTAPRDSGSPLMVEVDGELLIAGVLSGGSTDTSQFGDISWFTGVTEYREFIEQLGGQFVGDFVPELKPTPTPKPTEPKYGIENGSFEKGFSGWSTIGASTIQNSNFGITPSDGDFNALILNDLLAVSDYQIEDFLGLPLYSLVDLSPTGSFPAQGSAIKQTFQAKAGDTLTFDFNFLTDEFTPDEIYNDFYFVSISGLDILADTFSPFVDSATIFVEETEYQSFSYVIPETGTYTLGLGVIDAEFPGILSGVLIDNVKLSSVPEPGTILGLFASTLGGFCLLKRKRNSLGVRS
ncbi:MAG: trypsin-like serine protease [Microcoleaceae cyanobacterium MO_207.B10]|nr:trypsin-like serine protease [Microcoleaceae cyanobacterium MO_207.B10]